MKFCSGKLLSAAAVTLVATLASTAHAQSIKVGVLNDQAGPFSVLNGAGSVLAARMAAEDFGGRVLGRPIEIVSADTTNKADVASAVATRWFDREGVSAIVDLPITPVALAVQSAAKQRNKITMTMSAGGTTLIEKDCSPTGFLWAYNAYSLARSTAAAVLKSGGDSWFFIGSDYAFGHQLERDAGDVVKAAGATVRGAVRHPINSTDFSSYVLQAKASGAKVVALANGGADTVNAIKQAREFGLTQSGQTLAALILFEPDVESMGLEAAQGLVLTAPFYWNQNAQTRAWSDRFSARFSDKKPTMLQAAVYSGVAHYLKALAATGADDGPAVARKMRELPVQDFMTNNARVRSDGYLARDFHLFKVKTPAESRGRGDVFNYVSTVSAAEVSPPLSAACTNPRS
jgi:branched-chain amino acid transport system substrate-binding protein